MISDKKTWKAMENMEIEPEYESDGMDKLYNPVLLTGIENIAKVLEENKAEIKRLRKGIREELNHNLLTIHGKLPISVTERDQQERLEKLLKPEGDDG